MVDNFCRRRGGTPGWAVPVHRGEHRGKFSTRTGIGAVQTSTGTWDDTQYFHPASAPPRARVQRLLVA